MLKSDADRGPLSVVGIGVGVGFVDVDNVFADPCRARLADPPVGQTVDDLVTALADLPGDATTAIDVTVDGFDGKQIEFTLPDYTQDPDCVPFFLWRYDNSSGALYPDVWAQGPNQHNRVWILDVDGTRLVIMAWYLPDTSDEDRAALEEIVNSIEFD